MNQLTISQVTPSKQVALQMSEQIIEFVEQGTANPLDAIAKIKCLSLALEMAESKVKQLALDELNKYAEKSIEVQGTKFEKCEVGTSYDFSLCGDAELAELESKIKEKKEFLKKLPSTGMTIVNEVSGEVTTLFPPAKKSTSSFKITLAK